jgi:hypothetical protein
MISSDGESSSGERGKTLKERSRGRERPLSLRKLETSFSSLEAKLVMADPEERVFHRFISP